jgi:hypothetical protein
MDAPVLWNGHILPVHVCVCACVISGECHAAVRFEYSNSAAVFSCDPLSQNKELIDAYKVYLPLYADAANPALQPRHWEQVLIHVSLARI